MWVLIFLTICALIDIRKRQIPVWLLILASVCLSIFRILHWRESTVVWLGGIAVGIVFLIVSKLTDEALGYGDSWMILLLGIYLGVWDLLWLLSIAFLLSAIMAAIVLFKNKWSRKAAFPFVPFLAVSYMGVLCL